jgi:ABC-type nitrate/sulfonate/bicarbonate transport system substrate-binding protein
MSDTRLDPIGVPSTNRARFLSLSAAGIAAAAVAVPAQAAAAVRVGYFPGVSALPLLLGSSRGIFAREGLDVTVTPVTSSADLFVALDAGTYEIGHTSIDNPIAYDSGRGDSRVTSRDFCAFLGVDDGQLRLVARPGIATVRDLRGKTVGVDAIATGFTFALRGILAASQLGEDAVTLVVHGGTQQRAQGLMAGRFDATLLTPPFDLAANGAGYATLARATDVIGRYQGIAVVARRAWLSANRATAVAYARAYRAALAETLRDRAGAVELLATTLGVTPTIAEASYAGALAPGGAFTRGGGIDLEGVRTVLRLRARYAPPGAGDDPAPYVDPSILDALR